MDASAVAGITTVALAVVGTFLYLARHLGQRFIDRSFEHGLERYRIETQYAHDAELERLRVQLRAAAYEHETRFSRLHEKRFEVLEAVAGRLMATERAFRSWTNPLQFGANPSLDEKRGAAVTAGRDLARYVEDHRIWLPSDLCTRIDAFIEALWEVLIDFDEKTSARDWSNISSQMRVNIPRLREQIEKSARLLIDPPPEAGHGNETDTDTSATGR